MTITPRNAGNGLRLKPTIVAFIAILAALEVHADDAVEATPYRPTVSNPAQLSAPGYLELEVGGQHETGPGPQTQSLPYLLKYAFTPDWGLLLGGDAFVRSRNDENQRRYAFGDTTLLLKHRIAVDDSNAFGFETGARLPTGGGGLGDGKADYLFNGIFSSDLGPVHIDFNAGPTWIGAREPGTGRIEVDEAVAASTNASDDWSVAGEVSSSQRQHAGDTAQILAAAAYNYSKRTVFDFGAARGLTNVSTHWTIFGGVTAVIGRLR